MNYQKQYADRINWKNSPDTSTPLNATNLNKMDNALNYIDEKLSEAIGGGIVEANPSETAEESLNKVAINGTVYGISGGGGGSYSAGSGINITNNTIINTRKGALTGVIDSVSTTTAHTQIDNALTTTTAGALVVLKAETSGTSINTVRVQYGTQASDSRDFRLRDTSGNYTTIDIANDDTIIMMLDITGYQMVVLSTLGASTSGGYAGLGIGKKTGVSSNIIDTDIDLHRAPIVGDRLLIYFDEKVTNPTGLKTYNNGVAVTSGLENTTPLYINDGLNILQFMNDGLLYNNCWVREQNISIPKTLAGMSDTLIVSPSDGQMLVYDDGMWKNKLAVQANPTGTPDYNLKKIKVGSYIYDALGIKPYEAYSISNGGISIHTADPNTYNGQIIAVNTGAHSGTTTDAWYLVLEGNISSYPIAMTNADGTDFKDALSENELLLVYVDTHNPQKAILLKTAGASGGDDPVIPVLNKESVYSLNDVNSISKTFTAAQTASYMVIMSICNSESLPTITSASVTVNNVAQEVKDYYVTSGYGVNSKYALLNLEAGDTVSASLISSVGSYGTSTSIALVRLSHGIKGLTLITSDYDINVEDPAIDVNVNDDGLYLLFFFDRHEGVGTFQTLKQNDVTITQNKIVCSSGSGWQVSHGMCIVSAKAGDNFKASMVVNGYFTAVGIMSLSASDGDTALSDLTDVDITSPTDGQFLRYNSTTGKWENADDIEIKTATGNPITLTDAVAGNAIEVSAEIVASQDLHGYNKPWVGTEKNKMPLVLSDIKTANTGGTWTGNSFVKNGLTFEVLTDSADNVLGVKVNGTASAVTEFYVTAKEVVNSFYGMKINGAGTGTSTNLALIFTYLNGQGSYINQFKVYNNAETTISSQSDLCTVSLYVARSQSVTDFIFYPMISANGGAFEQYSNICPITGFSSVAITDVDAESQTTTITVSLGSTIYGGTADITGGNGEVTHGYIASYNGETINTPWISDKSAYEVGATPITGAQVVYPLTTPTILSTTPTAVTLAKGQNTLTCNSGDMEITYKASGLDALKERVDDVETELADKTENSVVGTVESGTTASQAYAVGEHFIRNDKFCTAIATIASGATLTLNTNYVEGTIAEAVGARIDIKEIENISLSGLSWTQSASGVYYAAVTNAIPTGKKLIGAIIYFWEYLNSTNYDLQFTQGTSTPTSLIILAPTGTFVTGSRVSIRISYV